MKPEWRPNVEEFKKKFDPEKTKGQGVLFSMLANQFSVCIVL
jgi:hypothetical protein